MTNTRLDEIERDREETRNGTAVCAMSSAEKDAYVHMKNCARDVDVTSKAHAAAAEAFKAALAKWAEASK